MSPSSTRAVGRVESEVHLRRYGSEDLGNLVVSREGESKLGDNISTLDGCDFEGGLRGFRDALREKHERGAEYAVLGIRESVGPWANFGVGNTHGAWDAFLDKFVNIPTNRSFLPEQVLVVGEVDLADLQAEAEELVRGESRDVEALRAICAQIDERVEPVVHQIVAAGLEPIVVGGGHNITYPIQKAVAAAEGERAEFTGLAVMNFDRHCDFRPIEGRHSGNGFRYAHQLGILKKYHVIGLHENCNPEPVLDALEEAGFYWTSYDYVEMRRTRSWDSVIKGKIEEFRGAQKHEGYQIGIELDTDSIAGFPVSSQTPMGVSPEQTLAYLYRTAKELNPSYCLITEAAPNNHAYPETGRREVGLTLAYHTVAYMKGRMERKERGGDPDEVSPD